MIRKNELKHLQPSLNSLTFATNPEQTVNDFITWAELYPWADRSW